MILWEAEDLRPYAEVDEDLVDLVGGQPMEVVLLQESGYTRRCVATGVISECSPRGTWEGFRIPHSFFRIVRVSSVNPEFSDTTACCELADVIMQTAIRKLQES